MQKTWFILILLAVAAGCEKNPAGTRGVISRSEAIAIELREALARDSTAMIFSAPQIYNKGDMLTVSNGNLADTLNIENPSWLFVADVGYPFFEAKRIDLVNIFTGAWSFAHLYPFPDVSEMDLVYPRPENITTKQDAIRIFNRFVFPSNRRSAIYCYPHLLQPGDHIRVSQSQQVFPVDTPTWFFFVDKYYITENWPRTSDYIFLDANTGLIRTETASYPPDIFAQMDTIYYKWERANRAYPVLVFSDSSKKVGCCFQCIDYQNEDQNVVLEICIDTTRLDLQEQFVEYDITALSGEIDIQLVDFYYLPPHYKNIIIDFCTDYVINWEIPPEYWFPAAGKIRIARQILPPNQQRISLELLDMIFVSADGSKEIPLPNLQILDVWMNFCPG